jgi:hypothetical protein
MLLRERAILAWLTWHLRRHGRNLWSPGRRLLTAR